MSDVKDSDPKCGCVSSGRVEKVATLTAHMYGRICRDADICTVSADACLEYTFVAMIITHTLSGTAIEPITPEAENEFKRIALGLGDRLLARYHNLVNDYLAM